MTAKEKVLSVEAANEAREQLKAQEWVSPELKRKALAKDSSTDEWSCWCEVCCHVRNILAGPQVKGQTDGGEQK